MTVTFDAAAYKRTTRSQWEEAAEAWHRWGPAIEDWLGAATETMLDRAGVADGARVLDVAAGRRRPDPARPRAGSARAATCSPPTSRPRSSSTPPSRPPTAGLGNVSTRELDGEHLDVEPAAYDAVISRVGLIYFPDQQAALRGMYDALRPGGRLSSVVYSTADRNGFFSVPVGHHPPPGAAARRRCPASRDRSASAVPASPRRRYAAAGFRDVTVDVVESPVRMATAAECVRFEKESFGALHQMLSGLPEPRARGGLGRDRRGAGGVRGSGRVHGPLRDAGGDRDEVGVPGGNG